jgi:hypothetical protein
VSFRFVETTEVLCAATPCVAELPRGNVLLGFPVLGNPGALDVELVHVGPEPTVYRRSLSLYEDRTGATRILGIIRASLGAGAAITGIALLPVGPVQGQPRPRPRRRITLGAGAALLALGVWAIRHDAPTYRSGSANHFPLAPSSPLTTR